MRNASSNRQQDLYSSWFSSPHDGLELGPRFSVVPQDMVTYLTQDQSGFNTVSLLYYNKFRTVIRTLIGSSIVGCGISPYHILILTSKEEKRVPVNNGCAGRQGAPFFLRVKCDLVHDQLLLYCCVFQVVPLIFLCYMFRAMFMRSVGKRGRWMSIFPALSKTWTMCVVSSSLLPFCFVRSGDM
jgi:hypothetical protein